MNRASGEQACNRTVCSAKASDYAAARPDYPGGPFDALESRGLIRPEALVADVGAGTGLLTRGLLERGCRVVAVEPNAAMRAEADAAHFSTFARTAG